MRLRVLAILVCGLLGLSAEACNSNIAPPAALAEASVPTGSTAISAGSANLNAVSGVSDSALWAVGNLGAIYLWNGTKLVKEASGTTVTLRGVWAVTTDLAYAVGDGGTILQRQGGAWHQVGTGITRQVLTSVFADTTRVVAVGSSATVIVGTAAAGYTLLTPPKVNGNLVGENLLGVSGVAGGTVTAVGALGIVLQLNGMNLSVVTTPNSNLLAGSASSAGGSYYVGQQGTVYLANGGPLTTIKGCPSTSLRAVSTTTSKTGATVAWIVGWDGTICMVSDALTPPVSFPYTDGRWFNGIYAASPTSLWVVGASGTLLHGLPVNPDAGAADGSAGDGAAGDGAAP